MPAPRSPRWIATRASTAWTTIDGRISSKRAAASWPRPRGAHRLGRRPVPAHRSRCAPRARHCTSSPAWPGHRGLERRVRRPSRACRWAAPRSQSAVGPPGAARPPPRPRPPRRSRARRPVRGGPSWPGASPAATRTRPTRRRRTRERRALGDVGHPIGLVRPAVEEVDPRGDDGERWMALERRVVEALDPAVDRRRVAAVERRQGRRGRRARAATSTSPLANACSTARSRSCAAAYAAAARRWSSGRAPGSRSSSSPCRKSRSRLWYR